MPYTSLMYVLIHVRKVLLNNAEKGDSCIDILDSSSFKVFPFLVRSHL